MSDYPKPAPIGWVDLTVPDAERLRDFYSAVAGWRPEPVPMGDYADFNMVSPSTGQPAAGVCHARGVNEGLPPVWLIYITVESLDSSLARVRELGGNVLREAGGVGPSGRYAVIQDPAGAIAALFEPA